MRPRRLHRLPALGASDSLARRRVDLLTPAVVPASVLVPGAVVAREVHGDLLGDAAAHVGTFPRHLFSPLVGK